MDHTLLDDDIRAAAQNKALISPFRNDRLKGASYDVSVGETVIESTPAGPKGHSLKVDLEFKLDPGQSCIVSSLEKIKLPANMKGRISLRAHLQLRGLAFPGGIIDPGYFGILFFPTTNISNSVVYIKYDEAFASVEFVELKQDARIIYNGGAEIVSPSTTFLKPERVPYDLVDLSQRYDELKLAQQKLIKDIAVLEPLVSLTQRVQELVVLAALGSIVAAAMWAVIEKLQNRHIFYSLTIGGGVAALSLLAYLIGRRSKLK